MTMLKAGLAVAAVVIGAVASFLGIVVTIAAIRNGQLTLSYDAGSPASLETVSQAADPTRFWMLVALLGFLPMVAGFLAARLGWRRLKAPSPRQPE